MAENCIFCRIVQRLIPAVVLSETDDLLAIMDLYPATRGHALVLPKEHIPDIYSMSEELAGRLFGQTTALAKALQRRLAPAGMNLVQANGAAAGQTISHFHLHLVPRYPGDGVFIQFGHGAVAASFADLEKIASLIREDP